MSDAIISVENLGKKYRISHQGERQRYVALRDVIANKFKGLFQNRKSEIGDRKSVEDFWALKDVSFQVKQGEVVGIIGRNGAGKSTLLKILSRITEPTQGRVTLRGRVASLLEVGTGFHPELTGRENIFLNGAILGMSRVEIRKKFDEIVAFAEVEKFLDTPVKRYSSGMYVRLAFAVAAHLEPEILIVDEVLAVGDAEFQKKCLGKMKDVAGHGRTVLFVSHNMTAVSSLCDRAILLRTGTVYQQGEVSKVIDGYLGSAEKTGGLKWEGPAGDDSVQIYRAKVCGGELESLTTDKPILIELEMQVQRPIYGLIVAWEIWNQREQLLAYSGAEDSQLPPGTTTQPGFYQLRMEIPADTFATGIYTACLDLGIHNNRRLIPEKAIALEFNIENNFGIGRRYPSAWGNVFRPSWKWSFVANAQQKRSDVFIKPPKGFTENILLPSNKINPTA